MSKHMCKAPNSDINQPHPTHETTPNNMQVLAAECALPWPGSRLKRMSEIAFDSDRKRMSVVCKALPPTAADGSALPTPKSGEAGFAAGPADLNKRWVVCYVRWSIGGLVDQRQVNQPPMHMEQTNNRRAGGESKARVVLSKGAPEVLLGLCSQWMGADGKARKMDGAKLKEVDQWCDAFSEQVGGVCWCGAVCVSVGVRWLGVLGILRSAGEDMHILKPQTTNRNKQPNKPTQGLRTLALAVRFDDSGKLAAKEPGAFWGG